MTIGKFRLPLMSSLLVWAALAGDCRALRRASFIIPPLSRIFERMIEIVPTAAFGDALWITGKAFVIPAT
jgi:NitT/TauT family transport system permease protein